jgi:hypothetical protein
MSPARRNHPTTSTVGCRDCVYLYKAAAPAVSSDYSRVVLRPCRVCSRRRRAPQRRDSRPGSDCKRHGKRAVFRRDRLLRTGQATARGPARAPSESAAPHPPNLTTFQNGRDSVAFDILILQAVGVTEGSQWGQPRRVRVRHDGRRLNLDLCNPLFCHADLSGGSTRQINLPPLHIRTPVVDSDLAVSFPFWDHPLRAQGLTERRPGSLPCATARFVRNTRDKHWVRWLTGSAVAPPRARSRRPSGANCRRWRTALASRSRTAQMRSKEYGQCGSAASSHCFASRKSRRPRASVGKRYFSTHRTASSSTAIMSRCSGASFLGGLKCCAGKIARGWNRSILAPVRYRSTSIAMLACTGRHGTAVSSEYYARGCTRGLTPYASAVLPTPAEDLLGTPRTASPRTNRTGQPLGLRGDAPASHSPYQSRKIRPRTTKIIRTVSRNGW